MNNEKGKNSGIIIAILAIISIASCGYLAYYKLYKEPELIDSIVTNNKQTEENNATSDTQNSISTNDTMIGEYYYVTDDEIKSEHYLDLMENNKFYYFTGATCGTQGTGTYEIQDNKLTLKFNFRQNCGGSIYVSKTGSYTEDIDINQGGAITKQLEFVINNDKTLSFSDDNNAKLKKISNKFVQYNEFVDNIIYSYGSVIKSNLNAQ